MSKPGLSSLPFFVAGGTLRTDAACYVTRCADQQLYEAMRAGEFAYLLTSRQMGKSSLMVRTAKRLRAEGFLVVVVDLTALGQNVTAAQWYFTLAERIARQIGVDEKHVYENATSESSSPLQQWVRFIEQIVVASDHQVVIFIDEIDLVLSLPFATDEFFAAIRQFYNRRPEEPLFDRLTFCLLGVAAPSDLIRNPQMTPFNIGTRIELDDFSSEEAAVFAAGLGDEDAPELRLNRVLYWTAGHPYLAQRLCQSLAAHNGTGDVDEICAQVFLGHRAREKDDNLLFVRERILNTRMDLAALLNLYSGVLRRKSLRDDEANPLIKELRLSGVCKPLAGTLRVRNPIYAKVFDRQWVSDSMPGAEVRRQRAAFRRGVLLTTMIASVVIAIVAVLALIVVRQRDENQRQLYASDITLAQLAWAHHSPNLAMELLARNVPQPGHRDPRGFEWYMLWNLCVARKPLKVIDAGASVHAASPSPDGQRIYAATLKNELIAFNATNGARLYTATLENAISWIAVSPDGRLLATADNSGQLMLWNAETFDRIASRAFVGSLNSAGFSGDNRLLVVASGTSVVIWHVPDLMEAANHLHANGGVRSAAISPDGQKVAISDRKTVEVWTSDFSRRIARFPANQPGNLAFCPDSHCVADANYGAVDIVDLRTKKMRSLKGNWGFASGLSFFPDGHRLMNGGSDGTVRVWDLPTERELDIFVTQPPGSNVSLFAGGQRILAAGPAKEVTIWNANYHTPDLLAADEIYSLSFSPNGQMLVSGGNDGRLLLWDPVTRALLKSIDVGERIEHVAFLSSSQVLINTVHHLSVWDLTKGAQVTTLASSTGGFTAALSPNGTTAATADRESGEMRIFSTATGQAFARYPLSTPINALTFSHDGRAVAVAGISNEVLVWHGSNQAEKLLGCPIASNVVAFSPSDNYLMEGCDASGDIYVWNWPSKRLKTVLQGHRSSIKSLEFSPDGTRFVSTSDDGSLRIWDSSTFQTLLTMDESALSIETAAFSLDRRFLAVAGDDHRIRLWDGMVNEK